jgi:hypothetical protein
VERRELSKFSIGDITVSLAQQEQATRSLSLDKLHSVPIKASLWRRSLKIGQSIALFIGCSGLTYAGLYTVTALSHHFHA